MFGMLTRGRIERGLSEHGDLAWFALPLWLAPLLNGAFI
jgi:hypothetical protein